MKGFTYDDYKDTILELLAEGYTFIPYSDSYKTKDDYTVCFYHDIDLHIQSAIPLARIEHKHGVQASYHLMVASQLYNIFSHESFHTIGELQRLGHTIGLHWDPHSALTIGQQLELIHKVSPTCDNISVHRLAVGAITGGKYFADSRGRWRFGHPLDSREFKVGKALIINFHPFWYSDRPFTEPISRLGDVKMDLVSALNKSIENILPRVFDESN